MRLGRTIIRLPSLTLIALARFYQKFISPLLGKNCRFEPTCSVYFIQSVDKYGAIVGSARGIWRILKCHPFHPGGYDPP